MATNPSEVGRGLGPKTAVQDRSKDYVITKNCSSSAYYCLLSLWPCLFSGWFCFLSVNRGMFPEARKKVLTDCLGIEVRVYHIHFLSLTAAI